MFHGCMTISDALRLERELLVEILQIADYSHLSQLLPMPYSPFTKQNRSYKTDNVEILASLLSIKIEHSFWVKLPFLLLNSLISSHLSTNNSLIIGACLDTVNMIEPPFWSSLIEMQAGGTENFHQFVRVI